MLSFLPDTLHQNRLRGKEKHLCPGLIAVGLQGMLRLLRIEAMRILQEAREEHLRGIAKGWNPDFIIGTSFNANFLGRCLAQPLAGITRPASSSRSRP